ncbi:TadE/TadG family type IV pilus assembly protein [Arthrobacter sp. Br18]|uniref:TadE/TadG family type IV pilus assembly protein n=1 Tax=Arthrobacter sp. Br18 TaxID=1312954 RepID=UPI0020A63F39|nr:TadE/TadG family type IV pilus assembly protein [Arthrobacter sp. Br18]
MHARARIPPKRARSAAEDGSAVVDFALIGGLLTVIFLAIVQLTLVLHVRNTLVDAASSGARFGTLADRTAGDAEVRTASLISLTLGERFSEDISVGQSDVGGVATLEITVRAPLPVLGLIGPAGFLEVRGHAALPP